MKKPKKSPRKQLEKFSTIFMQLGLVLVLFVTFLSLEYKTEKAQASVTTFDFHRGDIVDIDDIPILQRKEIKIEQPQERIPRREVLPDLPPEVVDNDDPKVVEPEVQPKDSETKNFLDNVNTIHEEEDIDKNDDPVSMSFVQKAPVFKGCEGLSEAENRICFEKKMKKLVQRHFDTELANDLGLARGKKKILTQFVIDKNGFITDIQIRAPHPRLKKETSRIIKKIPKFTPGVQNNENVKVRYTLPIAFMVE
ncbi:energy transducer TonB [Tenacibaculum agarivorans]|uniref:energy transducer TonB n=1 Tax=Tenacibaculum agarivorans TaxID=1908389 RepID=UPI00094B99A4|nr:energy transducer TonB [Tenacibaculum agarivorans]